MHKNKATRRQSTGYGINSETPVKQAKFHNFFRNILTISLIINNLHCNSFILVHFERISSKNCRFYGDRYSLNNSTMSSVLLAIQQLIFALGRSILVQKGL